MEYKLYQVAVIELPKRSTSTKEDDKTFKSAPRLVLEPVTVIARSEQDAALRIAMTKATELKSIDPERVEVIVRPF